MESCSPMRFLAPEGTELLAIVATGSVFHVALVRDRGTVAIAKRLLPRVMREPAARAAMAREAMALSLARHPSLPELMRVGSDREGPFTIQSRVEGASVRAIVEGFRARARAVPATLIAHVAAEASGALAELHELGGERGPIGLSHGDLGPEHVVLGAIGDVRFVDLGAARFAGMDPALETEDRGTLPYAPPEVARGERAPGQAADVYALAATLIFLATGGPIWPAQGDAAMLLGIGERGLDRALCDQAAGISQRGREALRRAITLDPAARLTSARELASALAPPC